MAFLPMFQSAFPEAQFLNGLGHADLLKPGIVGAEHHLMAQTSVDPGNGDIPGHHLGIEFLGIVKIQCAGVGVDIGILHHQHGSFPYPGPAKMAQTDPEVGMLRRNALKCHGLAVGSQGIRLPA